MWISNCVDVIWFSKVNLKDKEKEANRRSGKTISKSGQEWTLLVQLGRFKTGQDGK